MSTTVNLGGDRLGSGNKMKLQLRNYERSTHDLGRIWRSTMATGTLVPFLKEVALPGDTFDINLRADVKTLPTLGPLFASFKLQLDIFMCPMRLYNAQLHMNKVGVGLDMSKVKFPNMSIITNNLSNASDEPAEIQQINQSSLLAYLGVRGNGYKAGGATYVRTYYNAMPFLMYWDIYKNYYSNKQEEVGAFLIPDKGNVINFIYFDGVDVTATKPNKTLATNSSMDIWTNSFIDENDLIAYITEDGQYIQLNKIFANFTKYTTYLGNKFVMSSPVAKYLGKTLEISKLNQKVDLGYKTVKIKTFNLSNIDTMRENILKQATTTPLTIAKATNLSPYSDVIDYDSNSYISNSKWAQSGLALKTYQSDIFNNWLKTEWLDGPTGINEITAVSTVGDKFTIDTLNLSKKVYDMLNRIAVSGGSYEDWLQAVYSHNAQRRAESPIYLGGLSKEIIFQEVISTAEANEENPLGTLAGRGVLGSKHKGGYIVAKVDEPSYIMGIVSITPRIDYSQGNDWDVLLSTMNDLHKPALDGIGFQDLVTWKMASWEYHRDSSDNVTQYSAGKQPAWLDYMTSFNRCFGDFADPNNQMFMTLNRRYEIDGNYRIKDLTTYIDPAKYNYIFANTRRDAQNFWVQLGIDITARRKMSAKQIPNL